jgi:2-methylisocitrate lyase-like PEP mutase family enzyme
MAAQIDQFRTLHVVGEPLVLYNIWDPGNRSRAERKREFPER